MFDHNIHVAWLDWKKWRSVVWTSYLNSINLNIRFDKSIIQMIGLDKHLLFPVRKNLFYKQE